MPDERSQRLETRHRGYETATKSYTDRRYGHPAMQAYRDLRTERIRMELEHLKTDGGRPKLLDVGCGTGVLLGQLSELGDSLDLVGVDFSERMLSEGRETLAERNPPVQLVRGNAFELPFSDDTFDVVVNTRFIHQYPNDLKRQLLSEIRRVLRTGGIGIVEFYSYWPWLMRYAMCLRTSFREHMIHATSHAQAAELIGSRFRLVPLNVPGSTRLASMIGLSGLRAVRGTLASCHMTFAFDQYLAVFRKP